MAQHDHHTASRLTKRAGFYEPEIYRDPDGGLIQDYILKFTAWANVHPLRGGEQVMQARLVSKNPAIITIRASNEARLITSEWRVQINGQWFDIKEDPRESQDRAFLEMLAES